MEDRPQSGVLGQTPVWRLRKMGSGGPERKLRRSAGMSTTTSNPGGSLPSRDFQQQNIQQDEKIFRIFASMFISVGRRVSALILFFTTKNLKGERNSPVNIVRCREDMG